jgi:hypothetical protein
MPRIILGHKLMVTHHPEETRTQLLFETGSSSQKAVEIQLSDIEQTIEKSIKNLLSKQSLHLNIPSSAFEVNLKQNGLVVNWSQVATDELTIQKI